MKLAAGVQEALVVLLCYDEKEGGSLVGFIEPRHFDPIYREIAELALDYRTRHHQAPGVHTSDIFDVAIERDDDRAGIYERLFKSVAALDGKINARYIIDQAVDFVRMQTIKKGIAKAIRELEKDSKEGLAAAEATLSQVLRAGQDLDHAFQPGVSFIEDPEASIGFLTTLGDSFPTGIRALDRKGLGPSRQTVHLFIAPPKAGKSWWLVNLGTRGYQYHISVLVITLEMSEAIYCQRLVQSFWSMSKRQIASIGYRRFVETRNVDEWGTVWDPVEIANIPHLMEDDARENLLHKMRVFRGGSRIVVKGFPTGSLSIQHLEAYLDLMANREHFYPDLVLVDYADLMKLPRGMDRWESLIEIMIHLRRIAQERNFAIATASQTKISGARAGRTDVYHVGGAWDKIAVVDSVLTYAQTDEEKRDGLARVFQAAARSEEDRFEVLLSQSYPVGQFVLSSIRLGSGYYAKDE